MTVQFLTDAKGKKKSVLLNYGDFQKLIEKTDELACIKAYDMAKGKQQKFSPEKAFFQRI